MADRNNMIQTGVQQIMLGTVTKSYDQAAKTLARIKAAGYDGIELNSFMIHPTSFLVRILTKAAGMPTGNSGKLDWKKLIRESGLNVISLHTDLGSLKKNPDQVAAEAKEFGTSYVVITGMYRFDYTDQSSLDGLCRDLNECGKKLAEQGISLLYHNHNVEWQKVRKNTVADDRGNHSGIEISGTDSTEESKASEQTIVKETVCAYEYIMTHTDPSYVNFEFDSYWPTEAGVNVPKVMKKLGSRMKLWHVTDRGTRLSGIPMTPILKSDSVELGTGNMDLKYLKEIALSNGVTGVILETHRNWINKDPLQSIELSGKWIRENINNAE